MDFQSFTNAVKKIDFGKKLPNAIYIHESAINAIPVELQQLIETITSSLNISQNDWNIVKLYRRDFTFTLLHYPTFDQYPYPPLAKSITIDLSKLSMREASYENSENPPILHRKECFLKPGDDRIETFIAFTQEGEKIGLYENTSIIGFRNSWARIIKKKGYYLDKDGYLLPISESKERNTELDDAGQIHRHKTAISRDKLSTPLFLLAQKGYLDGRFNVLDYGCGLGDDLKELEAHDIDSIGWDPVHRPDIELTNRDIVNLGFVINVIEDKQERNDTLKAAFALADKILLVSAMLGNERVYEKFKPFKDGVITARNTFQKYFSQGELQYYIENILGNTAIALGPGVFIVFKDKLEEQNYQLARQRTKHQWRQLTAKLAKPLEKKKAKVLYDKHQALFDDFWYTTLDLGRLPANDEFEQSDLIRQVANSHSKAIQVCKQYYAPEDLDLARKGRIDDLSVYFALSYFKKRDSYTRMPKGLQRDIREFFGKYTDARDAGKHLLFSLSGTSVIYQACVEAHKRLPASELNGQHDFIFHKQYLNQCPKELRAYIGCATQLYGELENVSLIKAHITSGKVTLMVFDDWGKDQPLLTERIKIKMREQDIDFFDYIGDYQPQPLLNKQDYT